MGNKKKVGKREKTLDELITEGVEITRVAQEGDALYSKNNFIAVDTHNRFSLWREDVREFVQSIGLNEPSHPQWHIAKRLFLSGDVPLLKGGIEYGDPRTEKSQKLLRDIRKETSERLEWLHELRKALGKQSAEQDNPKGVRTPDWVPPSVSWEDIVMTVKDGHTLKVQIGSQTHLVDFNEMGFRNDRTGKPDVQWALLLALAKSGGQVAWEDGNADDKYKKIKQRLAGRLKAFFGISEDPFYDYRKEKAYKIKSTMVDDFGVYPGDVTED